MIETETGLRQTIEVMAGQYRALAALHRDIAPLNFQNYLLMAQGPIDYIRQFQREIHEYLGIAEQMASAEPDEPAQQPQPAQPMAP
jgi:hypothetical protein